MPAKTEGQDNVVDARELSAAELHRAVMQRGARRILLQSVDQLYMGIWEGDITFNEWLGRGVQIELADGRSLDVGQLKEVHESWQQWQDRQRRRRAFAGLALSVVVLLAAFLFIVALQSEV